MPNKYALNKMDIIKKITDKKPDIAKPFLLLLKPIAPDIIPNKEIGTIANIFGIRPILSNAQQNEKIPQKELLLLKLSNSESIISTISFFWISATGKDGVAIIGIIISNMLSVDFIKLKIFKNDIHNIQ